MRTPGMYSKTKEAYPFVVRGWKPLTNTAVRSSVFATREEADAAFEALCAEHSDWTVQIRTSGALLQERKGEA